MKVYPVNLNIENKKCVVVGGGKVALRKISGLLAAGAKIEVIAPEVCEEILQLYEEKKITLIFEKYSAEKISDGIILIAATSAVINAGPFAPLPMYYEKDELTVTVEFKQENAA